MLILSRRASERILIGDDIWLVALSVGRGQVRIGIDAPADVTIRRGECVARVPDLILDPRFPVTEKRL